MGELVSSAEFDKSSIVEKTPPKPNLKLFRLKPSLEKSNDESQSAEFMAIEHTVRGLNGYNILTQEIINLTRQTPQESALPTSSDISTKSHQLMEIARKIVQVQQSMDSEKAGKLEATYHSITSNPTFTEMQKQADLIEIEYTDETDLHGAYDRLPTIAHDSRNPVTGIKARLQLAERLIAQGIPFDDPRVQRHIEGITQSVEILQRFINHSAEAHLRNYSPRQHISALAAQSILNNEVQSALESEGIRYEPPKVVINTPFIELARKILESDQQLADASPEDKVILPSEIPVDDPHNEGVPRPIPLRDLTKDRLRQLVAAHDQQIISSSESGEEYKIPPSKQTEVANVISGIRTNDIKTIPLTADLASYIRFVYSENLLRENLVNTLAWNMPNAFGELSKRAANADRFADSLDSVGHDSMSVRKEASILATRHEERKVESYLEITNSGMVRMHFVDNAIGWPDDIEREGPKKGNSQWSKDDDTPATEDGQEVKPKYGGSGIGLHNQQKALTSPNYGGDMIFTSQRKNGEKTGAILTIELPLIDPTKMQAVKNDSPS